MNFNNFSSAKIRRYNVTSASQVFALPGGGTDFEIYNEGNSEVTWILGKSGNIEALDVPFYPADPISGCQLAAGQGGIYNCSGYSFIAIKCPTGSTVVLIKQGVGI